MMGILTQFVVLVLISHTLGDRDPYIVRPCPHLNVDCIKHQFLSSGICSSPVGKVPDPVRLPLRDVYLPNINGSIVMEDILLSGMNGDIVEFYINRKTDRAVLTFRLKDFDIETKKAYITYLPQVREPVTAVTTVMEKKGTGLFTVVFEGTHPLNLRHTLAHSVLEILPKLTIGTEPLAIKDPGYQNMLNELFSDLVTAYREGYLTAAPIFSKIFIQYTLCDFGIRD